MTTIQTSHRAGILCLAVAAAVLLTAAPAQAQFGREFMRYSMYGTGPYGYGARGYYKAAAPEPPAYHNVRVWETDYGYDPQPVYDGSLPTSYTVESYARTPAHVPVPIGDALARPEYHPAGRGVYGPYGPFIYGFGAPNNVYRSQGIAR